MLWRRCLKRKKTWRATGGNLVPQVVEPAAAVAVAGSVAAAGPHSLSPQHHYLDSHVLHVHPSSHSFLVAAAVLVAAAGFDFDAAAAAVVGLTVFLVADWRSVDQGPHCGFHRFLVFGCCPLHCYAHPLTGLVAEAVGCLHSAGPEDSVVQTSHSGLKPHADHLLVVLVSLLNPHYCQSRLYRLPAAVVVPLMTTRTKCHLLSKM